MLQTEIARILNEIADMLDVIGDKFRPRSYRRAARAIENTSADLVKLMEEGRLTSIPGVGESIASKIEEFIQTGRIRYLDELREKVPPGVAELLRVPEVGPKTAMLLYQKLGVNSIDDLEAAAREHRIRGLKGMGPKTEENILRGIALVRRGGERIPLGKALPIARAIEAVLRNTAGVKAVTIAGSIRRMRETIGDVDILVTTDSPDEATRTFTSMPMVADVLATGDTKTSVLLREGLQVDMRIVPPECYGSALQYFTGSKDHNIKLREIAQKKRMKLSEYGLFEEGGRKIAGRTEEEIYSALGMKYIEPELRENTGEIEAAIENKLPTLIAYDEVPGDFHVHTSWSDGRQTIREVASFAKDMGYRFVCITDHSKTLRIAHGLDEEKIIRQLDEIRKVNSEMNGSPLVLAGLEVDIKQDGSLDISTEVLEQLDVVIASVHSGFKLDIDSMTKRICDALSTGVVKILGHPTGRIIGKREPYPFDAERIFDCAAANNVWMEINAYPERLDLNDRLSRMAKEMGLKLALGTDSHDVEQMRFMQFGVAVARRAWLEKKDVANFIPVQELRKIAQYA